MLSNSLISRLAIDSKDGEVGEFKSRRALFPKFW